MPQRTYRFSSLITRFVLLSLAAVTLSVLRPARKAETRVRATRRRRSGARRVAASLSFATLFFAGAAFSAGAGDVVANLVEQQVATADSSALEAAAPTEEDGCETVRGMTGDGEDLADATTCPTDAEGETPADTAPLTDPAAEAEAPLSADTVDSVDMASAAELVKQAAANEVAVAKAGSAAPEKAAPTVSNAVRAEATAAAPAGKGSATKDDGAAPMLKPETQAHTHAGQHEPELDEPNTAATIWLQRSLPDPTPPSKRLTKKFAKNLTQASRKHRVHWSLMLGVLRARGHRGSAPATKAGLNRLGRNLVRRGARRDQWSAVLSLEGRTAFADRAIALTRYHRAVGLRALVRGLEWAKPMLTKRLLADQRVGLYSGGRLDVLAGRVDVRVIVLIRFLAEAHGQVTVTSLKSGHRLFSRPGVVSAHIYGLAVDIAALGGQTITGTNQLPGSVTEQAVRNMLLLPAELRPVQVISLLGLGGPSFPMANHYDHIHAGF